MSPMEELCAATRYPGRVPRVMTAEWVLAILARTGFDIDPEGVLYHPVIDDVPVIRLQHGPALRQLLDQAAPPKHS